MKCVAREGCGCYDGETNTHYSVGDRIPTTKNCMEWYVFGTSYINMPINNTSESLYIPTHKKNVFIFTISHNLEKSEHITCIN